jgi:U3 small nucleolar RNA-associated protein 5
VIATASTIIKTWDIQNKTVTKKLSGHSAPIQNMKYTKDGKYLISSSKDRFVYLWNLSGDSNSPLQSFTCDGSPSFIDLNIFSKTQDFYYLLAVSENSSVNIWKYQVSSSQAKSKALKPEGTVNCTNNILCCQFYNDSQIILASGNGSKPKFDKVDFVSKEGELIKSTEVKSNIKEKAKSEEKNAKIVKSNVSVISDANMPMANSHVLEEILVRSDIHLQKSDLSLEEKLETLGLSTKPSTTLSTPKADSMHTVLIQGLHTKDRSLLESCMEIRDITIIKNTGIKF